MKKIKKIIPYFLSLALSLWLVRYTFRNINFEEWKDHIRHLSLKWILSSAFLGLTSHLLRAYRWKLLLDPLGFKSTLFKSYMALMVGYMTNLLVPRLGTVVHIGLLSRLGGLPMGVVLGTFALERIMDFISLGIIVLLTFYFCSSEIQLIIHQLPFSALALMSWWPPVAVFLGIAISLIGFVVYRRRRSILAQLKPLWDHIKEGFYSIRFSKRKKWIVCVVILKWLLYYLSDYVGIFALQATSTLNWKVGLAVLTMSTFSFAIPIQGGIGAYHLFVSSVLLAYGIEKKYALLYATLTHATHCISMVIVGLIGLLVTSRSTKEWHAEGADKT